MLVTYKAHRDFSANRGRPKIFKGTTLYAIKHKDVLFVWSYLDKAQAEMIDEKMSNGPKDLNDAAWNWRHEFTSLVPSGRKLDSAAHKDW